MNWEPWTGCYYESEGCKYCYYYGPFSKRYGQNAIEKTQDFSKPVDRHKNGSLKMKSNSSVATCFATDFFIAEADEWRGQAWSFIKQRQDLDFLILTKRIDRFAVSLPDDWGDGYGNVYIGCTVENQEIADYRLPLFASYPIKRRFIACSPILGPIDLSKYLGKVSHVTVGGESGRQARECDFSWVMDIRAQCLEAGISFWFKNTGSLFRNGEGTQRINLYKQHAVAREFDINIGDEAMFG
ncbi:MAG: phage Gp37/Gp68 family protein [Eubacteriaceae bacterium]|jgi:protein gp37|nr:phage Gp37/Gp68 family protein [Eubacteriaceae bacterium]